MLRSTLSVLSKNQGKKQFYWWCVSCKEKLKKKNKQNVKDGWNSLNWMDEFNENVMLDTGLKLTIQY